MIHVNIACDECGDVFHKEWNAKAALDIEAITCSFFDCVAQIGEKIDNTIDVPMLVVSKALNNMGVHLHALARSSNGARAKRQAELAEVCVVLSGELATESMGHEG